MKMTMELADSFAAKARLFRGFSDASRLGILEVLRGGPRTVTGIVAATGLTQPNVSNHLACLLDCGLAVREQQGRFAIYSLADDRLERLLSLADEVLGDAAEGVHVCPRYPEERGIAR
jgi:ArsR family transcriptional regulator, cadmium/lead-responsive transcriptional repressor